MAQVLFEGKNQRWLEPSCGEGVFINAVRELGVPKRKVFAVDISDDQHISNDAAQVWRGQDFLHWAARKRMPFDCIVGNPPYFPIRLIPEPSQSIARNITLAGTAVGKGANIWLCFLLKSIDLLGENGNLAFVLPASFEYADYCKTICGHLRKTFSRVDIIRSNSSLFEDVKDGSVVLVCRGKHRKYARFARHNVANLDEACQVLRELDQQSGTDLSQNIVAKNTVELRSLVSIRLGCVTGDSKYFVLSENQRRELRLPMSAVQPVLGKSRHIKLPRITVAKFQQLVSQDERVWLFRPTATALRSKYVMDYLDHGNCNKDAFKVRIRDPWYQVPLPKKADAFLSGMSNKGLWFCFNECERLTATNTLYVASFRTKMSKRLRHEIGLSLLSPLVAKQIRKLVRIYPDGLAKLEPGDIGSLRVPIPVAIPNARRRYNAAVKELLNGENRKIVGVRESDVPFTRCA